MNEGRPVYRVEVDRKEFQAALKKLAKTIPGKNRLRDQAEAVLSYDDGHLIIEILGMKVGVPATGNWEGSVRFPSIIAFGFAKVVPLQDPLVIRAVIGRLELGSRSFAAVLTPAAHDPFDVPVNPTLLDLLRVARTQSPAVIEQAGLKALVEKAETRREELVASASQLLAPLGIEPAAIERLVLVSLEHGPRVRNELV